MQSAAAAGHAAIQDYSAGFRVVASTAAVDARDNTASTGTGHPIHWLGGSKVADSYADFYDGTWDDEANSTDESGSARLLTATADWPFTGSDDDGTADSSDPLGAATTVRVGRPDDSTSGNNPIHSGHSQGTTNLRPFYALSQVFVVSSEITVPSNWSLIPSGLSTGDRFRLLFIPSTGTDASSDDIADYNTLVQTAAAAGHADIQAYSASFRMVGSTEAVDARDNTGTTTAHGPPHLLARRRQGRRRLRRLLRRGLGRGGHRTPGERRCGHPHQQLGALDGQRPRRHGIGLHRHPPTSRALGNGGSSGTNWVQEGRPNSTAAGHGPLAGSTSPRTEPKGVYALSGLFVVGSQAAVVNAVPVFSDTPPVTRSVPENTAAGENVGTPVAATDTDTSDSLTYSLGGTDAASFSIVTSSGQIQTKSGVTYDHEAKSSYSVEVSVTDATESVSVTVTITVTDVNEPPARPAAPSVAATPGTTDSLDVSWTAPGLNGGPPLTGYELQYRKGGSGPWTSQSHSGTGTSATIGSLDASSSYQVQVRALNGETPSAWSPSGTGTTGVPGLSIADSSASEGDGTMAFAVTLSAAAGQQVTVAYATSGGTATQGSDYTAASGTLTFAPGDTAKTISVTLADDSVAESDETFQVTLSSPQNATLADATANGTITDNDQTSTALELSVSPDSVAEGGGARSIAVTVALDGAARTTGTPVTVSWTATGTATAGTDYAAVSGFTLTIPANQTSRTRTLAFTPTDDNVAEGDETVVLSASASGTGLADGSATLTIRDDETASTAIALSASPARVSENGGARTVTLTARLDAGARETATEVTVSRTGGDADLGDGLRGGEQLHADDPGAPGERDGDLHLHPAGRQRRGRRRDGRAERQRDGPCDGQPRR